MTRLLILLLVGSVEAGQINGEGIFSSPASQQWPLRLTQGETAIYHPAPERKGVIAARESLEPEGPSVGRARTDAKSGLTVRAERLDGVERHAQINAAQAVKLPSAKGTSTEPASASNNAAKESSNRKVRDGTAEVAETRRAEAKGIGPLVTSGRRDLRSSELTAGYDEREKLTATVPIAALPFRAVLCPPEWKAIVSQRYDTRNRRRASARPPRPGG